MKGERLLALALCVAAGAGHAGEREDLQAAYQAVLAKMAAHNQTLKGAPTPEYTRTMMALISEMQAAQRAITEFDTKGKANPWEGMSLDQLLAEREKLEAAARQAQGAAAAAAWKKWQQIQTWIQKAQEEKQTGTLAGPGQTSRKVTMVDASLLIADGEIERGLLAYEALIARGIDKENLAVAQLLPDHYIDFVADPDRAVAISRRILAAAARAREDHQASGRPLDHGLRLAPWNARRSLVRGLSVRGELKASVEVAQASRTEAQQLEEEVRRIGVGVVEEEQLSEAIWALGSVGAQYLMARDLAQDSGRGDALALERAGRKAVDAALSLVEEGIAKGQEGLETARITLVFRRAMLQHLEDPAGAVASYEEGRRIDEERRGNTEMAGQLYLGWYGSLQGEVLLNLGRLEEAEEAARSAERAFGAEQTWAISNVAAHRWKPPYLLGRIAEARGDLDTALAEYRRAADILKQLYGSLRSGKMKGAFLKIRQVAKVYRSLVRLLVARGELVQAFQTLEDSKSTVLLDMLQSLPLRQRRLWPPRLLEREKQLKEKLRGLRGAPDARGSEPAPSDTRARDDGGRDPAALRAAYDEYDLFLREVATALSDRRGAGRDEVGSVVEDWSPGSPALDAATRSGRVVVSFFDDGEQLSAFVLKAGQLEVRALVPSSKVKKRAARFRRRITSKHRRWEKEARSLYAQLVAPWADLVEGAAELVLVPSSGLASIPYAALVDEQGRPLGDRVAVSLASQASLLAQEADPQRDGAAAAGERRSPCLVLADPDGSLPFARTEGSRVAEVFGAEDPCEVHEGEGASEALVKDRLGFSHQAPSPRVLHLATHGLLEKGLHLFSSLVLAPGQAEDGALTFGEIFNDLDLRETEVVVLSACNTAIGGEGGGDEVLGLSRAFQYAGAPWVVASLWEVSDEASAALMEAFYRALREDPERRVDQALARAQGALRAQREDWRHPYYWAAFSAYRR